MNVNHVTLILNPGSRSGRGVRLWQGWQEALAKAGVTAAIRETQSIDHVREMAGTSVQTDAVVAVGGDGTINAVLNGLMDAGESAPPLGVLYAGTSPDFCRFHGIPIKPALALETLLHGRVKAVDVGCVHFHGWNGEPHTAWFGCSVNVGIGADVAARANRWRRWCGDAPGTGMAVLVGLIDRHPDLTVTVDDQEPMTLSRCCNLCIAKSPYIASGLKFGAELTPDDGRLALLGVYNHSLFGLLRLLPSFYRGAIPAGNGVYFRYGRTVAVRAAGPVKIEFDGDPHGFLPATVTVERRRLKLIGPAHDD